jgi:AcrR family transcriptional regulator
MSSSGAAAAHPTRRAFNPRQAETVERVAAAALEELRAVGYDGLTVRSVAGRATVAPATAYTYFSSKNHLIAEIFWRRLTERPRVEASMNSPLERVIAVFDDLATFLAGEPELAAATTSALLGTEPDVKALRVMIGTEINARIADALGEHAQPDVLDLLTLAWSGAMLQAGMGHARYEHMGPRLARAARLIMDETP